ncbi:MAG: class I SAM-dependent methyltransferase [Reyranellaceae bacterium]
MNDWTDGYLADVEYAHSYNGELNPLRVRLALLVAGLSVPRFETACELGFGQGVSINLHAAASQIKWFGTDFNPTQVGLAKELGRASGADVKLFDEAFTDFIHRPDLPDFDFIGMHGIWSWVSRESKTAITEFIRRKLKVRGVVYIGYNVVPGWASFAPLRHLMAEHARLTGATGSGKFGALKGSLDFVERFLATAPGFLRQNPKIVDKFATIKVKNPQYLVHEFLNGHWQPDYFTTMVDALAPAKIGFACPANYLEHYDAINLTNEQWTFLQSLPDDGFRQSVRDFMINQQFRCDYWGKGVGRLTPLQRAEALRAERIVLISYRPKIELTIRGALGEVGLHAPVYAPILDYLSDCQVRTIGEVEAAVRGHNLPFPQVLEAIMVMAGSNHITSANDEATMAHVRGQTDRLNDAFLDWARSSGNLNYLASPVTGGGVPAGRIVQNFMLGVRNGRKTPAELAEFVWRLLDSQGQKIVKDARPIETAEGNIAELVPQATAFLQESVPVLKALKIM